MHTQNTHPPALREDNGPAWQRRLARHWQSLIESGDARQAEIGRRMQQRWKEAQQPPVLHVDDGRPLPWAHVLDQVTGAQRPTRNPRQFKGGHEHAHASRSGTCVSVDTALGKWYCSSCRLGGTAITWVMAQNECSYLVACRMLLDRYGEADGQ